MGSEGARLEWELTGQVLAAAVAVHSALGPGFLESIYDNALVVELTRRGIEHVRQLTVQVAYEGVVVGVHKPDLMVGERVVVELKAVKTLLPEHFAVVRSYLQATGCPVGLLLNFNKRVLEAKRVFPHDGRAL